MNDREWNEDFGTRYNAIINIIRAAGAETDQEVVDVLEDGETLAALGITDKDQEAVEEAHADLSIHKYQ